MGNGKIRVVVLMCICAGAGVIRTASAQGDGTALGTAGDDTRAVSADTAAQTRSHTPGADTALLLKGSGDSAAVSQPEAIPIESRIRVVMSGATSAVEKTRRQGYGIGGGFSPGIAGVSMKPVFTMVSRESMLKTKTFPGFGPGYQLMLLSGGLGYLGFGNGMRIGGGGWGGTLRFPSDPYTTADGDSMVVLSVKFSYGGVLLDKVWIHEWWNIIFGGMWAFGNFEVVPDFFGGNGSERSAFAGLNSSNSDRSAKAGFTGLELHGGGTYTVFNWLHLGLDLNGLFFLSASGFAGQGGANGFLGVSPGGRIRLIFGNLG